MGGDASLERLHFHFQGCAVNARHPAAGRNKHKRQTERREAENELFSVEEDKRPVTFLMIGTDPP